MGKAKTTSRKSEHRCGGKPKLTPDNYEAKAVQDNASYLTRTERREAIEPHTDLDRLEAVERLAATHDLELRLVAKELPAGTKTLHYGLYRGRWLVGEYWPTTRTLRVAGVNSKAETLEEAIVKVAKQVGDSTDEKAFAWM